MFRPEIPLKYKQVEYIQFNGGAYIDTEIPTSDNLKVEVKFNTNVTDKVIFGARQSSADSGLVFGIFNHYKNFFCAFGGATIKLTTNKDYCDGIDHTSILSKDIFKIDDEDITLTKSTFAYANNIYLGTWNTAGNVDSRMYQGKIYSFKIYDGEDIVCDLVPVKNESGVAGFYDTVEYKFIPSATTEQFEAGNEIQFDLTLADKLNYLIKTKKAIRKAIIEKSIEIDDNTPFRDYAEKILDIKGDDHTFEDAIITRNISDEYVNNRVTSLGTYAFRYCRNLKKFSSTSLTTLTASSVFQESGLEEFYAPNLINANGSMLFASSNLIEFVQNKLTTMVGTNVFQNCTKFKKFVCKNLTGAVGSAFSGCSILEYCDLGSGTPNSSSTFTNCNSLNTLVLRKNTVATITATNRIPQTAIDGDCFIYVPDDLVELYKTASNWSTVASQFKPLSELEEQ